MFQHIIPNNTHKYKKWGDNILWDYTINRINDILINDIIFKFSINNNIKNNDMESKNPTISKLNYYITIFIFTMISDLSATSHISFLILDIPPFFIL